MNRSGALFRLIKSLNQNEKRYFSLLASAHRDSSDYLRIFRAIDAQKIYDEKTLQSGPDGGEAVKYFAVKKIQLYQLLLRSLRNYHEGRSFDFTLKEMMIEASLLADKALFRDCHSVLLKAKKIALQYEEWKILLEILHKEYTIIQHLVEPRRIEKEILRINREERLIISQLNNYGELTHIALSQRMAISKAEDLRGRKNSALESLMSDKFLKDEKNANSFRSKSLFFLIHSTYQVAEKDYKTADKTLSRHVSLYEQHPHFITASPGNYLSALNDLMLVHFRMERYNEALQIIRRLRELPESSSIRKVKSSKFRLVLLSWTFRIELAIAMRTGRVKEALQQLHGEEEYFERHARLVDSEKRNETYLALASCYSHMHDYKKAVHFIQRILQDSAAVQRYEVAFITRLLQMIIHFEEGNFDLLDYLAVSLKRIASKRKKPSDTEKALLKFAMALPKFSQQKHYKEFALHLTSLNSLKQKNDEPLWFDYFDVTEWLKSKV